MSESELPLSEVVDSIVDIAQQHMAREGFVAAVSFIQGTRDPETGQPSVACRMLDWNQMLPDKDLVRRTQDSIVYQTAASFVVNVTEGWVVTTNGERPEGPLSEHPGAEEVLEVHAEHRDGNWVDVRIPIVRPDGGQPYLDMDQARRSDSKTGMLAFGRFTHYFRSQVQA